MYDAAMARRTDPKQPGKTRVTLNLDNDVLAYFRARAAQPNAAPYQTQINNELRAVMEGGGGPYAPLINDKHFIAAVAERLRGGRHKRS